MNYLRAAECGVINEQFREKAIKDIKRTRMNEYNHPLYYYKGIRFVVLLLLFKKKINKYIMKYICDFISECRINKYFKLNIKKPLRHSDYIEVYRGKNIINEWKLNDFNLAQLKSNIFKDIEKCNSSTIIFGRTIDEIRNINGGCTIICEAIIECIKKINNGSLTNFPNERYIERNLYDLSELEYSIKNKYRYDYEKNLILDYDNFEITFFTPQGLEYDVTPNFCNLCNNYVWLIENYVLGSNKISAKRHILRYLMLRDNIINLIKNK